MTNSAEKSIKKIRGVPDSNYIIQLVTDGSSICIRIAIGLGLDFPEKPIELVSRPQKSFFMTTLSMIDLQEQALVYIIAC